MKCALGHRLFLGRIAVAGPSKAPKSIVAVTGRIGRRSNERYEIIIIIINEMDLNYECILNYVA